MEKSRRPPENPRIRPERKAVSARGAFGEFSHRRHASRSRPDMPAGVFTVLLIAIALTDAASVRRIAKVADACDSPVYCDGPLLKTVQLAELFTDSKTFVDLSQIHDMNETLNNFDKLMQATKNNPNRTQVAEFVRDNFVSQAEIHNWTIPDWKEDPRIIKRVQDPYYQKWLRALNVIWKQLARQVNEDIAENPDRHSLIYVQNGFIVPGGRFKEFYYWDSYWVIEGLLLCEMHQTARGMIDNFLHMVEKYGFVPNGGRVYYLMRSQPPFLIPMVAKYLNITGDYGYVRKVLPTLEKEFNFWQRSRMLDVKKNGRTYSMARYSVDSPRPRPESYTEDYRLAQKLPEAERGAFYNNIKAAAESGWDFSNRWCIGTAENRPVSLLNVSTEDIIPVDLNALLQRNARILSEFHSHLGNTVKALHFAKIAVKFQQGIDNVLWNEAVGTWLDYDAKNGKPRTDFYPSNLTPLYTKSYDPARVTEYALNAVRYLKKQKIDSFFGGTPASLKQTGEQWDFPNAWPPLQSLIILGLYQTHVPEAVNFSKSLAGRWIGANHLGFTEYGKMFEKYDAVNPGRGGGGGEYSVQEGFGWTNGVIFEVLSIYPDLSSASVESFDNDNL